ncbi:FecR domain-containing protein [Catenovulum sp. 2E275]|uniref:FecR family protein n=1 Tax=Catenovulum sp. 2E275 TaxID=2980497 RepID=UPI0021CE5E24|nr:FecR domain-containing protein [Catenovulum sp. 2E275]MCU4677497.1 FecR domain-containing protein [Catenovulum sp. 2E275]
MLEKNKMAESKMNDSKEKLQEEALDWILLLQDNPDNSDVLKQHKDWLASSENHQRVWQESQNVWELLGNLDTVSNNISESPQQPEKNKSKQKFFFNSVLYFASAACLLLTMLPGLWNVFFTDYYTQAGQVQTISLEDGSKLTLGADSAIKVEFNEQYRKVEILQGQVYFDVVHNPNKPFLVKSDDLDVQVLGTSFDIELGEQATWLGVESGVVKAESNDQVNVLTEGMLLNIQPVIGENTISNTAQHNVSSWREGRLFVKNRKVKDIIYTLERYFSGYIYVADDSILEQKVTGSFQLNQVESALSAVIRPYGGKVTSISPYILIVNR